VTNRGRHRILGWGGAMSKEQQRIADRILKLLALANSTQFEAEASTARKLAEQLIAAHNITLGPGRPSQDTIVPFAKGMRWEGKIAGALADVCACMIFFNSNTLAQYSLVGTIWNLDCLEYMLRASALRRG
jgi:hypothetical protein